MFEQENIDKIVTLLQFAKKSGKVILGRDAVAKAVIKRNVRYVIIATDLSLNTIESLKNITEKYKINVVKFGNKELFLSIFGKYTGIVGISDENFIKGINIHMSSIKDE